MGQKPIILIVGMGQGISLGVAEHFAETGFRIAMISRSAVKLKELTSQ